MDNEKVYIVLKTKKAIELDTHIYVKDISDVYCQNTKLAKDIEGVRVYNAEKVENWLSINFNEVAKKVLERYPNIDISPLGPTEVLLEIKSQEKANKLFEVLKISFVSIILFFGAALGIIYFHEDINMKETLAKMYFTFSGEKVENPLIMTLPYSLGLAIGVITFFKRLPSKSLRRRKEPGPLDIELYLYDKDMEQYILNELKKKELL